MIISRTPYRISFFGGGTDYPAWFEQNGGQVLSTTINKYCYITARILPPFFEHKSRIVWKTIENVMSHEEIKHPVVRATLQHLQISHGVEIHYDGDLPARAGLGSSSAFTVGLYNALYAMKEKMISKGDLAKEAIYTEKVLLNEEVGVQDQISVSFGGFNKIEIRQDHTFLVSPLILPQERLIELEQNIMLFYTGIARFASEVAVNTVQSFSKKEGNLHKMQRMVTEAITLLMSNAPMTDFGKLLHESWMLKKDLAPQISPTFVDEIYERAMKAGAKGGKLLGAGGGGFMMFIVDPSKQHSVLTALKELLYVPIQLDFTGSQIIFYEKDSYTKMALEDSHFITYTDDETSNQKVVPLHFIRGKRS